jgi:hypothetical protein
MWHAKKRRGDIHVGFYWKTWRDENGWKICAEMGGQQYNRTVRSCIGELRLNLFGL